MTGVKIAADTVDGHSLSCQELVALVTSYLEGALSVPDRDRFEAHLEHCEGCRHHLVQIKTTIKVVHALGEHDFPKETRERFLTAFRSWKPSDLTPR